MGCLTTITLERLRQFHFCIDGKGLVMRGNVPQGENGDLVQRGPLSEGACCDSKRFVGIRPRSKPVNLSDNSAELFQRIAAALNGVFQFSADAIGR